MSYNLKLLKRAERDIGEILEYKADFYAGTADRFISELEKVLDRIAENPFVYQVYENNPRYRRAVVGDYLLFYRVFEKTRQARVYRVLHSKRDINQLFIAK